MLTDTAADILACPRLSNPNSRQGTSAKRPLGESEVASPDCDIKGKTALCLSPCSDNYFVLSAADGSNLSSKLDL